MAKVKITRTVTQEVEIPDPIMKIVQEFVDSYEVGITSSTSGASEIVFSPLAYEDIIKLVAEICEVYEKKKGARRY
tara:strand:+ start:566 stop:793 length:228 start_codon:yes stop_codon:yes gene_type:complete